jgi:protein-tyrosine phosphatase
MHRIPPHALWIGSSGDLNDWRRLYDVGIQAVMHVAYEEPPLRLPHDFVACRFPVIDGDENSATALKLAIATLTHFLDEKFACLVCCQAGLSRSPAIAAAALARTTKRPFTECLDLIRNHHACAVHPGLVSQIQKLF